MSARPNRVQERKVLYYSLLAVRNSRNPKVRHQLPRKWEVIELSGLDDLAVKSAVIFLEQWGVIDRTKRGWIARPLPELFCWEHGLDVERQSKLDCEICYERFLRLAEEVYKFRKLRKGE